MPRITINAHSCSYYGTQRSCFFESKRVRAWAITSVILASLLPSRAQSQDHHWLAATETLALPSTGSSRNAAQSRNEKQADWESGWVMPAFDLQRFLNSAELSSIPDLLFNTSDLTQIGAGIWFADYSFGLYAGAISTEFDDDLVLGISVKEKKWLAGSELVIQGRTDNGFEDIEVGGAWKIPLNEPKRSIDDEPQVALGSCFAPVGRPPKPVCVDQETKDETKK